jgi:hypothetical protein
VLAAVALALPDMLPMVILWLMLPLILLVAAAVELPAEGVALPLGQTGAVFTFTFESLQNVTAKLVVAIVGTCQLAERGENVCPCVLAMSAGEHVANTQQDTLSIDELPQMHAMSLVLQVPRFAPKHACCEDRSASVHQ